ncbi:glycoside hydrolase family 43 protein [uncultured Muribaculum sp.]|uniref:glycoside hydrolase family 43 protein n=1 Tax=uncultured Muribaculum sp. TaxID=1918613 RepID=UPI0025E0BC33|nr:glycoside hydrolase family 43 protein [uncultured Muribaculum sp.]
MKRLIIPLLLAIALSMNAAPGMPVIKGERFPDTQGDHINAHGGGIMEKDGTYYWYGEHRGDGTPGSGQKGVVCYTSSDLHAWTPRGVVLAVTDTKGDPLEAGCIIERPKVVFCPATAKYVMWFHHELKGVGYGSAHSAVAVADNPLGPFRMLRTGRVNPGVMPVNLPSESVSKQWSDTLEWWTPQWRKAVDEGMFTVRDLDRGQMARDMGIFVDSDGKAYHIYSSESNLTLQIAELDSTFTRHTGKYVRLFPGGHNEAPAMFKHDGVYWMITSGCTGWEPNEARLMRADNILGPWKQLPNPCRGAEAEKTFCGQSTFVMRVGDSYTFMADIWNPKNLADSRHLWLPVKFDSDGVPFIDSPDSYRIASIE